MGERGGRESGEGVPKERGGGGGERGDTMGDEIERGRMMRDGVEGE